MTLPLAIQTLYADLVQQLSAGGERPATIYRQRKGGLEFLYARRTVGASRVDEFVGPSHDAASVARAGTIREARKLANQRRSIVSALKRAGLPAPTTALSRVLDALSSAGLFEGGVLVGTAAYQCYPPVVGAALPSSALMTQDADFATSRLSLASAGTEDSLLGILRYADPTFRPVPGLKLTSPPSSFIAADGFRLDVVTPVLRRSDRNPMPLHKLSAAATPLQHLAWLIRDPVPAAVLAGSGIFVRVPQPARFAVHKLIVAQRREANDRLKRRKDLVQAQSLITALQISDPQSLRDAFSLARRMGKNGWSQPIERSLREIGSGV